ncbi:prepilin peptidase [Candidatus Saccharibacteria bacterium]|nr:prepilin peptidase [Candidatus Saccharibacteria bacterium]
MRTLFLILLFILGACFGSFLCCQARRLRLKATKKIKNLGSRSICLSCKTQLKWFDNIPIISWLALKGKCRKCGKKIGLLEILSELGLALAFLALGTTINPLSAAPLEWAIFIFTLFLTLNLAFLAIYDGAYGELPTRYLIISIFFAFIIFALKFSSALSIAPFSPELIFEPLLAVTILGGLYLILYLISKGKWVGDGDWLLGTALGLALSSAWLALINLFLANVLACIIMFPIVKKSKNKKIYFGPFMVIAFIITLTFSNFLTM